MPLQRLDVPFIDDLGIDFVDAPPGEGCVALDLQPRHLNSWKVVHGGVIMTMLDVAMAIAGRSLDPGSRGGVTVEMKTSFLQPGAAGTRLVATGRAFHRSTTMSFCEGEVRDVDDRLIAKAIGTFKSLKQRYGAAERGDDGNVPTNIPTSNGDRMSDYRRIVLAGRPDGAVSADHFRLEEQPVPVASDGQVVVRNHYLSLDPYMRGRMNESKSYAVPQPIGETMIGATVGEVVESRNPKFAKGDTVVGMYGWSEYGCSDGAGLMKVDTTHVAESAYLGPVGMPGMTAWYGLNKVIEPKSGETVVVSAASGAVGSVVGQLARLAGCRAVGIAGGPDKCAYVVDELGFDACIDYKAAPDRKELYRLLKEATPDGVDGYFENVGGVVMNTVLARLNPFARVAVCGLISGYDDAAGAAPIENPALFLVARFKMQGFIVADHLPLWPQGLKELGTLVATGRLKYRESIADGIASAPEAFMGLLQGRNFGKQLVKLS